MCARAVCTAILGGFLKGFGHFFWTGLVRRTILWQFCAPELESVDTSEHGNRFLVSSGSDEYVCETFVPTPSPDMFVRQSPINHQSASICFTICLFISPDLDGSRALKTSLRH
jgi:hypothetical protein